MAKYDITLKNEITYYGLEAKSEEEAKKKALDYWGYRTPKITIKGKKKVKKTVYYSVVNFYKQDVLVDDDLNNDEIKDLWNDGYIETLTEPELADNNFPDGEVDYDSIYVE